MGENIVASKTAATASDMSKGLRYFCVGLLVLLGFSLGVSEFVVIGVEQDIADAYGVTLSQAGQLISFFSVAYAVFTPVLAITTGRFKRFQLLVAYALIFCVANVAQALAPSFGVLLVARILVGSVSGGLLAVGVTYIPELVNPSRTSMVISVVYAAFSVAMVVVTSVGKLAAELADWRLVMWGSLVLSIVSGLALVLVLPREGATDEPATMADQAGLLKEPQILTGMLIFLFAVGSVYVFYGYVTPYLEDVLGMDALSASGALMGYGGMCFVSNLISGWVSARFGVKGLLVSFPMLAALLLVLWLLGPTMPAALVVIMGIGLLMYVVSVPCISLFMDVAAKRHPKALTLASSLEPMAFNMGIAFGTAVGGVVVAGPGISQVGVVGAFFALVAMALVVVTLWLNKRSEKSVARES